MLRVFLWLCAAAQAAAFAPSTTSIRRLRGGAPLPIMSAIAVVVDAEIEPSRVDEFLKVMEADVKGSREEPGCLRFDVVQVSETRAAAKRSNLVASASDSSAPFCCERLPPNHAQVSSSMRLTHPPRRWTSTRPSRISSFGQTSKRRAAAYPQSQARARSQSGASSHDSRG